MEFSLPKFCLKGNRQVFETLSYWIVRWDKCEWLKKENDPLNRSTGQNKWAEKKNVHWMVYVELELFILQTLKIKWLSIFQAEPF